MAQYYDYILGLIPLALGGITTLLVALGVSITLAVPLAAAVAVALIGHGLFVRSPGASDSQSSPQPNGGQLNSAE
ncbi:hypothetical protein [Halococcus hamelinensis]|uniref:Uncharacterized protein n=1 Tax=Halococcus hamelinensis 100A6 TaxID=1132509 RepID=M0MA08_9EURY|nr:hypothetical protein [Halococcus hamelinensis]EMA41240.1 hypothetical protein C447_02307 [Halococcus hamelinensis 100A6]